MWKNRAPPTPLDFDSIADGSFKPAPVSSASAVDAGSVSDVKSPRVALNGTSEPAASGSSSGSGLKDQKELSLQESLVLFVSRSVSIHWLRRMLIGLTISSSTHRLAQRLRNGEETISFDKDDDDTLDFVTAASNLRSAAYGIPRKTRWEIKGFVLRS